MGEDPHWAALDVATVRRFPGPIVVTRGDSGPAWLLYVALGVAERIGRESRVIAGAGHSPHLTNPDASQLIEDFIAGQALGRAA